MTHEQVTLGHLSRTSPVEPGLLRLPPHRGPRSLPSAAPPQWLDCGKAEASFSDPDLTSESKKSSSLDSTTLLPPSNSLKIDCSHAEHHLPSIPYGTKRGMNTARHLDLTSTEHCTGLTTAPANPLLLPDGGRSVATKSYQFVLIHSAGTHGRQA